MNERSSQQPQDAALQLLELSDGPPSWNEWAPAASSSQGSGRATSGNTSWRLSIALQSVDLLSPRHKTSAICLLKSNSDLLWPVVTWSLLIIYSTAANLRQLNFGTRLRSFAGVLDNAAALLWAKRGFYNDGQSGASCCHCGARADCLTVPSDSQFWHQSCRPACELFRLTQLLDDQTAVTEAELGADAIKFKALIKRLEDAINGSTLQFVESFGFSNPNLLLVSAAHYHAGGADLRPGELVQLLQQASRPADCAVNWLKLVDANSTTKTGPDDAQTPDETTTSSQHPLPEVSSSSRQADFRSDGNDSPLCQRCFSRNRDRVTLPCGHFLFCSQCLLGARQCPECAAEILAVIAGVIGN